jgi:hypothetical protein
VSRGRTLARARGGGRLIAAVALILVAVVLVIVRLSSRSGSRVGPVATLYGAAGSFGQLETPARVAGGARTTVTLAIPGWGFAPGEAAYFTAVASDGTVFVANEPQTDDQTRPTAQEMAISAFTPASGRFETIVIPTSTGATRTTGPWPNASDLVGGADIADLGLTSADGSQRLAFLSAMPYEGWSIAADGVYPTLGYLSEGKGGWSYDAAASESALTISRSATPTSGEPCAPEVSADGLPFADCRLPAEMDTLAGSRDLVVTQYVGSTPQDISGGLMVLNRTGAVAATYAYPPIVLGTGEVVDVHPREVDADPVTSGGVERFVVIFDTSTGSGSTAATGPFVIQEFGYEPGSDRIVPLSAPVLSGDRAPDGRPLGVETAAYDSAGNLWAAQSENGTLTGGPLAVYRRRANDATLARPGCTVPASWTGEGWGATCRPDAQVRRTATLGVVRSLDEDPRTHAMVAATLGGDVLAVRTSRTGAPTGSQTLLALPLGALRNRATDEIGFRKGTIDPHTDTLYLPVQQLQSATDCPTYPCAPQPLDQWLYAVRLPQLLAGSGH